MSTRMKLFLFALAAAALLVSGCRHAPRKPPEIDFNVSKSSSVVVLGVSTPMRLRAYQGWNEGKDWQPNTLAEATINELPQDGYVVVQMKPSFEGESYGILRVIPAVMNVLSVCTEQSAAVFEVPPSSVVYVGDFDLTHEGEYEVHVGFDFDKALAFVKRTYPEAAAKLSKSKVRVAKVTKNGQCDGKPVTFVGK